MYCVAAVMVWVLHGFHLHSIFLRVSEGDGLEALIIVPNRQKEFVQEAGKYDMIRIRSMTWNNLPCYKMSPCSAASRTRTS